MPITTDPDVMPPSSEGQPEGHRATGGLGGRLRRLLMQAAPVVRPLKHLFTLFVMWGAAVFAARSVRDTFVFSTTQAEALPPDVLADVVEREEEQRRQILEHL
ncbi:hypothetical protein ABT187_38805 [Streptomyces sp. NPDC001817]|uniref:hypothetical protein n=1 Tax=Streptomyces sp. NPDC001817 TaxID=3154398 RepID=UPI003318368C